RTTTVTYTLSLHDALPICGRGRGTVQNVAGAGKVPVIIEIITEPQSRGVLRRRVDPVAEREGDGGVLGHGRRAGKRRGRGAVAEDRKSTRLNSSHVSISYA